VNVFHQTNTVPPPSTTSQHTAITASPYQSQAVGVAPFRNDTVPSPSTASQHTAITASPYQTQAVGVVAFSHRPSVPPSSTAASTDVLSLAAGESGNDIRRTGSWTSTHTHDDLAYEAATPSRAINGSYAAHQDPRNESSALLRFRYEVMPRIDSNNAKSVFGPAMMTLARSSKAVSDCIVHFMRARDESIGTPGALLGDSHASRHRLYDRLSRESPLEADVGRALLVTSDSYWIPPSEWAARFAPPVRRCAEEISKSRASGFVTEPLKTLLRLHLKIGKAPMRA
jgi:hypothetical protein